MKSGGLWNLSMVNGKLLCGRIVLGYCKKQGVLTDFQLQYKYLKEIFPWNTKDLEVTSSSE